MLSIEEWWVATAAEGIDGKEIAPISHWIVRPTSMGMILPIVGILFGACGS